VSKWCDVIEEKSVADAILDRLAHNAQRQRIFPNKH